MLDMDNYYVLKLCGLQCPGLFGLKKFHKTRKIDKNYY